MRLRQLGKAIEGKTVAAVTDHGRTIVLTFTDGTALVVRATWSYSGDHDQAAVDLEWEVKERS